MKSKDILFQNYDKLWKINWIISLMGQNVEEILGKHPLPYYGGDIDRIIFKAQIQASLRIMQNDLQDNTL